MALTGCGTFLVLACADTSDFALNVHLCWKMRIVLERVSSQVSCQTKTVQAYSGPDLQKAHSRWEIGSL